MHTHSAKAGALGRLAAHRGRVPLIVHTLHGFPFHEFQNPVSHALYVGIERRLSRITDAYLAVGTGVAVEALRRGLARPGRSTRSARQWTTRASFSLRRRGRARERLGLAADVPVVGTVGRLDYQKAPEVMLRALSLLSTPAILVWVGNGELATRAARQVQALGLGDRVRLLGNRSTSPTCCPPSTSSRWQAVTRASRASSSRRSSAAYPSSRPR